MSVTLSDLQTNLRSLTNRSDLDTTLEVYLINSAIKMLETSGAYKGEDTTDTISSPAISSGATGTLAIALPLKSDGTPDCRDFTNLEQIAPTYQSGLAVIERTKALLLYRTLTTLSNTSLETVVVENETLYFYPPYTADNAYSAGHWQWNVYYKKWLDALVNPTDNNYFTNNGYHCIMPTIMAMTYWKLREFDVGNSYLSIAYTLAKQFVVSEYGQAVAGDFVTRGEFENIFKKFAEGQQ